MPFIIQQQGLQIS